MKILLSWSSGKAARGRCTVLNQRYPAPPRRCDENEAMSASPCTAYDVMSSESEARAAGLPLREVLIPTSARRDLRGTHARAVACRGRRFHRMRRSANCSCRDIRRYRENTVAGRRHERCSRSGRFQRRTWRREMIAEGMRARLAVRRHAVSTPRSPGRDFDLRCYRSAENVDPCGENGEVHTCAYAGPMFATPLAGWPTARRIPRAVTCDGFRGVNDTDFPQGIVCLTEETTDAQYSAR
jgi:hypothetical protein